MSEKETVTIIGGGLAGTEAAHQAAALGLRVVLYEMRPETPSPAHNSGDLAELVCSNSLKSDSLDNASGILKEEMRRLGSLIIEAADNTRVPAGKALAVDRLKFSDYITDKIEKNPLIELVREEIKSIKSLRRELDGPLIISSGPLTSPSLSQGIAELTDSEHLYFYDAISPIIDAESIDYDIVFRASRYDNGQNSEGDYLNCPLNKEEYYRLTDELEKSEKIETRVFEKGIYFESCLPVEVIVERGRDTLRFGPARPVGIIDPRTGRSPFAVVQLRAENSLFTMYNMVGFQTKLKYPEQRRVFRMIPGLESAEFLRYGSVHRNTYIHAPSLLRPSLQMKDKDGIFFAGQIVGVEGYSESAAMGIVAGINAARSVLNMSLLTVPPASAIGSLLRYITDESVKHFQPMNINFGLFPPIPKKVPKAVKKKLIAERALSEISAMYEPTGK